MAKETKGTEKTQTCARARGELTAAISTAPNMDEIIANAKKAGSTGVTLL